MGHHGSADPQGVHWAEGMHASALLVAVDRQLSASPGCFTRHAPHPSQGPCSSRGVCMAGVGRPRPPRCTGRRGRGRYGARGRRTAGVVQGLCARVVARRGARTARRPGARGAHHLPRGAHARRLPAVRTLPVLAASCRELTRCLPRIVTSPSLDAVHCPCGARQASHLSSPCHGLPCRYGPFRCAPGSYEVAPRATAECFFVVDGVFFLTNPDGSSRRCVGGDTVVLPKGWAGHWDILEPVWKVWVEVE